MAYVERVQALIYQYLAGERLVRDLLEYDGTSPNLIAVIRCCVQLGSVPAPGDVELQYGEDTYIVFSGVPSGCRKPRLCVQHNGEVTDLFDAIPRIAAGPLRPRKSWWSAA